MMTKSKYIICFVLGSLFGCQKADLSAIDNLRNDKIAIIGHGGMGFQSPEVNLPANSFEGITKAVEGYQVDGVEVDVQLSADGVLFLYHDSRLQTLTDCLGCLYQHESEKLDECKYVSGFNTQNFSNQKLVRLETIIARFNERIPKSLIFLDLKTSLDCPQSFDISTFENIFLESLKALFTKYNCQEWVIVESANLSFLKELKKEIPEVRLNYFSAIDESAIEIVDENKFYGLSANFDQASKEAIRAAHDKGIFVTLDILKIRRDAIEMIEMSPDFIYTDNIPLLQSILN
ncbi:MAG: glycerophosphoryl diester phosphodiesterase [Saprospiraceae bacterium]|jgi:glycerophosphoryl diester phosphodiesterase